MLRTPVLAALAAAVSCLACAAPGKAERIGTRPDGGSIMLSANNDKAWEKAKELMSNHCDGSYRVLAQSIETPAARGGPPPATPSAMADPVGAGATAYGTRIDYECTGGSGGSGPLPTGTHPAGAPSPAPSNIPQTQTPVRG